MSTDVVAVPIWQPVTPMTSTLMTYLVPNFFQKPGASSAAGQ